MFMNIHILHQNYPITFLDHAFLSPLLPTKHFLVVWGLTCLSWTRSVAMEVQCVIFTRFAAPVSLTLMTDYKVNLIKNG